MTQLKSLPGMLLSAIAVVSLISTSASAKIYQGSYCPGGVCGLQSRVGSTAPRMIYKVEPGVAYQTIRPVYIYGNSVPIRQMYRCATRVPDQTRLRELKNEMEVESQRMIRIAVQLESLIRQADYVNDHRDQYQSTRYAKYALRELTAELQVLQRGITAIDTLLAAQIASPVMTAPGSSIPIESSPAPAYAPTVPSASELGDLPGTVIDPSQLDSTVISPPQDANSTIPQSATINGPEVEGPIIQAPVPPSEIYQALPAPQIRPVPPTGTEYEAVPSRTPPTTRPMLPQEKNEMQIPGQTIGSRARNILLPLSNRGY